MSSELILRCRAAEYMNTSLVVMTTNEYHQYLKQTIDFHYPHLKIWDSAYRTAKSTAEITGDPIEYCLEQQLITILDTWQNVPAGFLANLLISCKNISALYQALTFQDVMPDEQIDLYEWWLTTPTGAESCSRDVGELRSTFDVGKGDEWELDLEAAILQYQLDQQPFIPVPTGYACAETLRRLRMNA